MKGFNVMRIQVIASDEMVAKVDKYANMMGVSRSALCSILIGQGIMGYEKSIDIFEKVGIDMTEQLTKAIKK